MRNVDKMITDMELALKENDRNLILERRVSRQIELMMARMEIMKSLVHLYKLKSTTYNRIKEAA